MCCRLLHDRLIEGHGLSWGQRRAEGVELHRDLRVQAHCKNQIDQRTFIAHRFQRCDVRLVADALTRMQFQCVSIHRLLALGHTMCLLCGRPAPDALDGLRCHAGLQRQPLVGVPLELAAPRRPNGQDTHLVEVGRAAGAVAAVVCHALHKGTDGWRANPCIPRPNKRAVRIYHPKASLGTGFASVIDNLLVERSLLGIQAHSRRVRRQPRAWSA
mmetsp:Transcript_94403/g.262684  ORF Transcript_94403/g.262684 Transcript_94403/m.262684 type:complete len:215 (+) Transcript_94403:76-720(+)